MNRCSSRFSSHQEAEAVMSDVEKQIEGILDKDLAILKKDERTIGQWVSIFGRDLTYDQTKHQLIELESVKIDATLFMHQ
jgi:hypothetical protein